MKYCNELSLALEWLESHGKDHHCILFSKESDYSDAVVCLQTAKIFFEI